MDSVIERALRVTDDLLMLGNETFEAVGATFVRNVEFPSIRDANHVGRITVSAAGDIDELIVRADKEFAHCPHRRFDVGSRTPPEVQARFALDDYVTGSSLVSLLEGDLRAEPPACDIRLVASEADWGALEDLMLFDSREDRLRRGVEPDDSFARAMAAAHRRKTPPVRRWLAHVDDVPVAYFSSWEGNERVGQVEDLFVLPEYRHRGIATALIGHCVDDARAHGAGPVVIVSDPGNTPKHMYAAMGFRPVAIERSYWRLV